MLQSLAGFRDPSWAGDEGGDQAPSCRDLWGPGLVHLGSLCTLRPVPSVRLQVLQWLLCFMQLRQAGGDVTVRAACPCLHSLPTVQHLHRGWLQPPRR